VPAAEHPDADDRVGWTWADASWTVRTAAALVLVQAAGATGFAVLFLVDVLPLDEPRLMRAGFALGVVGLVLGSAAALVVAARALVQSRPWSRSFLVVAQIMALAIGVPMSQGESWVGWVVTATGLAGLGLLLHPATTGSLEPAQRGR